MGKRTLVLDQLVNDQRIAQGWADALRGVAPDIDNQLQECLGRLTRALTLVLGHAESRSAGESEMILNHGPQELLR